jgi:hypothetical protein
MPEVQILVVDGPGEIQPDGNPGELRLEVRWDGIGCGPIKPVALRFGDQMILLPDDDQAVLALQRTTPEVELLADVG